MNKFVVLAVLVACAYGVPVPEADGERDGRGVYQVQPFPAEQFFPRAAPIQQFPAEQFFPRAAPIQQFPAEQFFPRAAPIQQDPLLFNGVQLFVNLPNKTANSNSNGNLYILSDPSAYAYNPYYAQPQPFQPYPLFRHAPQQPYYYIPYEQLQQRAHPFPAESQADYAAPSSAEEQTQGRFFTVQVPSDLSSLSITKPTIFGLGNAASNSGLGIGITGLSGLNGISGVGKSTNLNTAALAALAGNSNIGINANGGLFIGQQG